MTETNDETSDSPRRRQPKQQRSLETREAILEAATELFAERGYDDTTTHQIAERAGVSVGALYRYFSQKEDLLVETYTREVTTLRQHILEKFTQIDLAGRDFEELVRMALTLALTIFSEHAALRRELGLQSRKVAALKTLRRQREDELHATVEQILSTVPDLQLPNKRVGAYLISLFMEALIDDHVHHRRGDLSDDEVVDAATDFVLSYLLGR